MRRFKEFHVWIPSEQTVYRTHLAEEAARIARQCHNKYCALYAISEANNGIRRHYVHIASTIKETRRLAAKAKRLCAIEGIDGD